MVKCLYDRAKRIVTKPSVISKEKKHVSSVLVSNGYLLSFLQKITKTRQRNTRRHRAYGRGFTLRRRLVRAISPLRTKQVVLKSETTLKSRQYGQKLRPTRLKETALLTELPANAAKFASVRLEDL